MQGLEMVPLAKVADSFGARVLVARLGAEGIVTQLRGGGIDGPYPMGNVEVLVCVTDLDAARELLLVDEVEAAFDETFDPDGEDGEAGDAGRRPPLAPWLVLAVVASLVLFAYVNTIGYQSPMPDRESESSGQEPE